MSSGGGSSKQQSLQNYEKDYLERLEKEKELEQGENVLLKMAEEAKALAEKDFIGFCVFCTMGVARNDMTYENNLLFHKNCFEQQGKNFPAVNKDLAAKQASARIELVQLKNLKIRTSGSTSSSTTPKIKTKKKKTSRRKKQTKRKPVRKKTKRRPIKRRKAPKRKKSKRNTKRRKSSRSSRRRPARRSSRRRTRPKTRRRTKRSTSRRSRR